MAAARGSGRPVVASLATGERRSLLDGRRDSDAARRTRRADWQGASTAGNVDTAASPAWTAHSIQEPPPRVGPNVDSARGPCELASPRRLPAGRRWRPRLAARPRWQRAPRWSGRHTLDRPLIRKAARDDPPRVGADTASVRYHRWFHVRRNKASQNQLSPACYGDPIDGTLSHPHLPPPLPHSTPPPSPYTFSATLLWSRVRSLLLSASSNPSLLHTSWLKTRSREVAL